MRKLFLLFILLQVRAIMFAQEPIDSVGSRPLNSINLNILGDASNWSVNYDRLFRVDSLVYLSAKFGLGYNKEFQLCIFGPCDFNDEEYFTIPLHLTGIIGKGRSFFEFGVGGTIITGETSQPFILYPVMGFRILPLRSGYSVFRIYGQVPFSELREDYFFSRIGLSFGLSF